MLKQGTKPNGNETSQRINILSEGTNIKGEIILNGDLRIDGEIQGTIVTKGKLVIGNSAKIEGDIQANNVEIAGLIKGKIIAKNLLTMKSSAEIQGDIIVSKLAIEPGAVFMGTCKMDTTTPPPKDEPPKTK